MALTITESESKSAGNYAPRRAAIAVCALVFMALLDSGFVAAIAPQIAADFKIDKTLVAASAAVYAVAAASVALMLAAFGARLRRIVWLPIASMLFVAAALIAALAAEITVFFVARALAGFAGGLISALAIAALADASVYAERGRQMSLVAVAYFLAPVIGIPASAIITQNFNWQASFFFVAVLSTIAGILVWRFPLIAIDAVDETENLKPPFQNTNITSENVGLAGRQTWFDSSSKAMGVIGAFFVSGGVVGFTSFVGVWLAEAFNQQPNEIAIVYAAAGAAAVGGGALGGILADRYGKRRVALGSSLGFALLLVIVPTFAWSLTLVALTAAAAFVAALRIAPLQALITELVDSKKRPAYIAWRNAASQLGIATAVAVSAAVYLRFGLFGVAVICATLTLFAWLCTSLIKEPLRENNKGGENLNSVPAVEPTISDLNAGRTRFRASRIVRFAVVIITVATLGLPLLLSFAITKAVTRSDERNRPETPATYHAHFENAVFTSKDGNRLSGWYLPNDQKKLTIVMTHGFFRSRYELLDRAIDFWRRGYAILLYDVRRHGKSTGEFSTMGYNERLDVIAAVGFAETRAPAHQIVLLGISMGAAATLLAAGEINNRVTAIIAESSFLSFRDTITHHVGLAGVPTFPLAGVLINLTAWRMNFNANDFDVERAVGRITIPILFIGGGLDQRMPTDSVLEPLYEAARHPLKQKLIFPEARHGQAYAASPAQYAQTVEDFLARAVNTN